MRRCRSRPWHPGGDPALRSERHLRLLGRGVPGQDGQPYPTTHRGPRVRRDLSLKSEDAVVCLLLATLPPHVYVPEITILPAATQALGKSSTAVRPSPRSGEHGALLEAPALRLRDETPTLASFADEDSYVGSDALTEWMRESGALSAGKVSAASSSPQRSTWRLYVRPIRPSVIATTRPASHLARGGSLPEYQSLRSGGTRFCDAGTFRTRMARRHHLYPRVGNRCGSPEAARGQSC